MNSTISKLLDNLRKAIHDLTAPPPNTRAQLDESSSSSCTITNNTNVRMVHPVGKIPPCFFTDAYKNVHPQLYNDALKMVAYGECRTSFEKDPTDNRIVFYGIRYIVENYLSIQWTEADVDKASTFYATFNIGSSTYPFPKELFLKFIREKNGYFPVKLEALKEGTVISARVPVYQITADGEYARLVTFLESVLCKVWYPTAIATLSRRIKDSVKEAFDESVPNHLSFLLNSRLHDFGYRGCTSEEQAILGGVAHLLNFEGSDTVSAAYYAQYHLNEGVPVACSVEASEHSTTTSWPNETCSTSHMIDTFGGPGKLVSVVADAYDYENFLDAIVPAIAEQHKSKGGILCIRPDSGDPTECVLQALRAGEKTFGAMRNEKGFKDMSHIFSVIQGDGINHANVKAILKAVLDEGYSASNVAFGMGGALLQRVTRDTCSFATKLNFIQYANGTKRDVMKRPKTDGGKISFPGILAVVRNAEGVLEVTPADSLVDGKENELQVVYDCGPIAGYKWDTIDAIRVRVDQEWNKYPKLFNPISKALQTKIDEWKQ